MTAAKPKCFTWKQSRGFYHLRYFLFGLHRLIQHFPSDLGTALTGARRQDETSHGHLTPAEPRSPGKPPRVSAYKVSCTAPQCFMPCLVCLLTFLLLACGGDSAPVRLQESPTTTPQLPDRSNSNPTPAGAPFRQDPEYSTQDPNDPSRNLNWGLEDVRAADAYGRIRAQEGSFVLPGAGVTVGFIDTGVDLLHHEFDPSLVGETHLSGSTDEDGSIFSHGTGVASIVVARRNQQAQSANPFDFHGIAWGARAEMFSIPLGGSLTEWRPFDISSFTEAEDRRFMDRLGVVLGDSYGIDILNMSFGYGGLIEDYSESDIRTHISRAILAMTQTERDLSDKTLFVVAAGNHNGLPCSAQNPPDECVNGEVVASSPDIFAGLPVRIAELRTHFTAVVATDRDGRLADFSNQCGIAAKWCMAAPGDDMLVAYFGPSGGVNGQRGYASRVNGTSFAAPMVAGGLALLKQYWSQDLGNDEILQRLYRTADVTPDRIPRGTRCPDHLNIDSDDACELSSEYGWGIMNLDAATRPVGTAGFPVASTVSGPRIPARVSFLSFGGPAGNAPFLAFEGKNIAVFDELNAPFRIPLDGFATGYEPLDIPSRLTLFLTPEHDLAPRPLLDVQFTPTDSDARAGHRTGWHGLHRGGHASLAPLHENGLSLSVGYGELQVSAFAATPWQESGPPMSSGPENIVGGLVSWNSPDTAFDLQFGVLRAFDSALAIQAEGAFGSLSSDIVFSGFHLQRDWGAWELDARAEFGLAEARVDPKLLVSAVSTQVTSALALSAKRDLGNGNMLRVLIEQPLRIENGTMTMRVPVGRSPEGRIRHDILDASLSPSGRQIDLGIEWETPLLDGRFRMGSAISLNPGHDSTRSSEALVLVGWRIGF